MANTVTYAPDLYSSPPKNAMPGARLEYREMAIGTTEMLTTIIFALGILPVGHRLTHFRVECTDMDSGSSATLDVGLLNSYYNEKLASASHAGWDAGASPALVNAFDNSAITGTTINLLLSASTLPQAGGWVEPAATNPYSHMIGVDPTHDRIIAAQFKAAPGTAVDGTLAFIVGMDWD